MEIIPAIDISGGKVVRLTKGMYAYQKVYFDDPVEVACLWESCGAPLLHVVDLDGAFSGECKNFTSIEQIARAVKVPIEVGGGLRHRTIIETMFAIGVSRVVLSTQAITDPAFLKEIVSLYPDRVVISIDAVGENVKLAGWIKTAEANIFTVLKDLEQAGVKRINYTDISHDGTLEGFDLDPFKRIIRSTSMQVVAGGGIRSLDDLKALSGLKQDGLAGVVIGKALYEKTIDLKQAIELYG